MLDPPARRPRRWLAHQLIQGLVKSLFTIRVASPRAQLLCCAVLCCGFTCPPILRRFALQSIPCIICTHRGQCHAHVCRYSFRLKPFYVCAGILPFLLNLQRTRRDTARRRCDAIRDGIGQWRLECWRPPDRKAKCCLGCDRAPACVAVIWRRQVRMYSRFT